MANRFIRKILFFFIVTFAITGGFAFFEIHSSDGFKQKLSAPGKEAILKRQIDSIVTGVMNRYNIPGIAIGVVKDGSMYYAAGYGVRDIQSREFVTDSSVFHTASVSKLFTAAAVMRLIKENYLTPDTRVIDIIPEINFTDKQLNLVTIKQLLNHSSGLPDVSNYHWGNQNKSETALQGYIQSLRDVELKFTPGTSFYYSNMGYDLLGYIVQKVSKEPFEVYVKSNVLVPAHMNVSDFRYYSIPDHLRTSPHSRKWLTKRIYRRDVYPYTREHAPSSTLNSSAKELCNWMLYFLNSLESENNEGDYYRKMITPSLPANTHIGFGFQLGNIDSFKTVGHFGGDQGFRSLILTLPEKNIGLVVLGNCDYQEDYRQEILYPIARLMLKN